MLHFLWALKEVKDTNLKNIHVFCYSNLSRWSKHMPFHQRTTMKNEREGQNVDFAYPKSQNRRGS